MDLIATVSACLGNAELVFLTMSASVHQKPVGNEAEKVPASFLTSLMK